MTDLFDDILSGADVLNGPPTRIERVYRLVDFIDPDYSNNNCGDIAEKEDANIITSELIDGDGSWHAPVLDLDIPHRYVPSSTPGHAHLYLDVAVKWDDLFDWLEQGAALGIFEAGWVNAADTRGFTAVRKEGIVKTDEERKPEKDVPHYVDGSFDEKILGME